MRWITANVILSCRAKFKNFLNSSTSSSAWQSLWGWGTTAWCFRCFYFPQSRYRLPLVAPTLLLSQISSGVAWLEQQRQQEGREHHNRFGQVGPTPWAWSHCPTLSGKENRMEKWSSDCVQRVDDLRMLLRLKVQDGSDLQTAAKTLRSVCFRFMVPSLLIFWLRDSYHFFVSLQRHAGIISTVLLCKLTWVPCEFAEEKGTTCYEFLEQLRHF